MSIFNKDKSPFSAEGENPCSHILKRVDGIVLEACVHISQQLEGLIHEYAVAESALAAAKRLRVNTAQQKDFEEKLALIGISILHHQKSLKLMTATETDLRNQIPVLTASSVSVESWVSSYELARKTLQSEEAQNHSTLAPELGQASTRTYG